MAALEFFSRICKSRLRIGFSQPGGRRAAGQRCILGEAVSAGFRKLLIRDQAEAASNTGLRRRHSNLEPRLNMNFGRSAGVGAPSLRDASTVLWNMCLN